MHLNRVILEVKGDNNAIIGAWIISFICVLNHITTTIIFYYSDLNKNFIKIVVLSGWIIVEICVYVIYLISFTTLALQWYQGFYFYKLVIFAIFSFPLCLYFLFSTTNVLQQENKQLTKLKMLLARLAALLSVFLTVIVMLYGLGVVVTKVYNHIDDFLELVRKVMAINMTLMFLTHLPNHVYLKILRVQKIIHFLRLKRLEKKILFETSKTIRYFSTEVNIFNSESLTLGLYQTTITIFDYYRYLENHNPILYERIALIEKNCTDIDEIIYGLAWRV